MHRACQEGHLPIAKAILATMGDQLTKENALKLNNKVSVSCYMFVILLSCMQYR